MTLVIQAAFAESGQPISLSAQNISVQKNERIVGYELHIKGGFVSALLKVPKSWVLTIKNFTNDDMVWNTTVEAQTAVGAAALGPQDFVDFIEIEKYLGPFAADLPLNYELILFVTETYSDTRRIVIPMNEIKSTTPTAKRGSSSLE